MSTPYVESLMGIGRSGAGSLGASVNRPQAMFGLIVYVTRTPFPVCGSSDGGVTAKR